MLALIKRNCLLYFRNRSGVLLSLLSAAISFILYLVFLKQGMHRDWAQLPQANQLLDNWLISGTLALTGITTTLAGLNQLVWDRERQIQTDLLLTDAGPLQLQVSYLVSATIVGIVMQLLMFFGMWGYFNAADGLTISGSELLAVFGLIVVSAAFATLVNAVILKRVRAVDNLGKIATILGTAAGFLVGIYIPVGSLPSFAQTLVKLTPGSYVASLYRQALMSDTLNHVFNHQMTAQAHFERLMGVRLNWSGLLTTSQTYQIMGYIFLGCLLAVLIAPYRQRRRIQRLN
ncbi:ABC transporter permease [Lactiplantibacillus plantarum]|uniref:ABC transporter permease n=1 Tax=Lactiplantibacillus plantarum TaxID=1590 RepID=UPI000E09BCFC|nr:ABC transporter permease [Lactiplantibacillus plantarum]AXH04774.1 multidrug ABC transporter permease [Lactiplantibacillus plantarum]MCT3205251.1 ABC transporter permease [Lactiplantibacillus plantarum]MCT3220102.1 ABC transporter permease [Lactiplantibacillus plantarum]MCT3236158.1 ABC transporter permease [Lactiplantibacillus plantarum]MCT3265843.1 ABC transporter permease [Lactiplantibacillus plantarum]